MLNLEELLKQTKMETRPYQCRVVESAYDSLINKKLRSALIESPTGSGKSGMAMMLAKALHDEFKLKIGWVAMRRHLLTQAATENIEKGFNLPLKFISMFDKDPPANLDMLIVDEAQHDVTSSMAHIHATANPKYIIGLSATPFRADRVKLCFDTVIKDAGIAALIRDGYLSQFHHFSIPKWDVKTVVDHYLAEPERWGKSIMYFHRLAHCREACELLMSAGIHCAVVDGASDTEAQIEAFHDGKLAVLLNCMKLTEGFNVVDLQTVFCRPSCKSVTIQMAGRVFRKHPDIAFKQIVQCQQTPYPFTKTALPSLQHMMVDGEWRTLTVNPHIEQINKRCLKAIANINTEMPAFIKKALAGQRRFGLHRQRTDGSAVRNWTQDGARRDAIPPEDARNAQVAINSNRA